MVFGLSKCLQPLHYGPNVDEHDYVDLCHFPNGFDFVEFGNWTNKLFHFILHFSIPYNLEMISNGKTSKIIWMVNDTPLVTKTSEWWNSLRIDFAFSSAIFGWFVSEKNRYWINLIPNKWLIVVTRQQSWENVEKNHKNLAKSPFWRLNDHLNNADIIFHIKCDFF